MSSGTSTGTDDRTVVGRTVAILDCVVDATGPVPLAILTRRTGIPKQTVRRIANDLAVRGMLDHCEEGYLPGERLLHHGLMSAHRQRTAAVVQPHLQDLHLHSRGQSAWFARMNNGVLSLAGAAFGRRQAVEMTWPCFPSVARMGPAMVLFAVGRIEVAESPELTDTVLRGGWAPFTRYSVTEQRRLRSLLEQARDSGFAHESEQTVLGMGCMAASVRHTDGRLLGVVGVGGACGALEVNGLRAALRRSAETLAREIADVEPTPSQAWNTPVFDHRRGIGYTWPVAAPAAP